MDETTTDDFTTDFGGLRRAVPTAVHRMPAAFPSALLGSGRSVTLRGAGHSSGGQTVTDGELLVTYSPETAIAQVREAGTGLTETPAGLSWHALERYLNDRGATAPVLTDHLPVSVGGTLSVGGIGIGSVRYGMQIDQVERIQLIDGTGTSRWCSRTTHSELFRFALGGLGTAGLIERAVLHTVPFLPYAHCHRKYHGTTTDVAAYTEDVAQRDDVDFFCAYLRRNAYYSIDGRRAHDRQPCGEENCTVVRARSSSTRQRPIRVRPDQVRLWTDFVVPAGRFALLLAAAEDLFHTPPLNRVATMMYVLIARRPTTATPFAFAPVATDPVSIGLGIYTSTDRDPPSIAGTRSAFRELLRLCHDLGGRPYLYGAAALDDSLAEQLYGADLNRLAQLRSSYRLEHVNADIPLVRAARNAEPNIAQ